jgi:hypothetical protein
MFAIPQKTSCIRYVLGSQPNGEEFFLIHSLSSIHDQFVVGRFLKSVIHSRNTSSGILVGSER